VRSDDDQMIVRYLLGCLPEEAAGVLEERYHLDDDFFDRVSMLEEELVRDYLNGSLSRKDTLLFEGKYLRIPELHDKVALARLLRDAAETGVQSGPDVPVWQKLWQPALAVLGLASIAVIAIFGYRLISESHRLEREVSRLQSLQPGNQRVGSVSEQAPFNHILMVLLDPGQAKGPDSPPRRLFVPPRLKEIRIELDLPGVSGDFVARAEIMLVEPQGRRLVLSRDDLRSVPTLAGRSVLLTLRPDALASGDYIIYLKKPDASEVLESYFFSVIDR
jgi:hypothetical protein